MISSMREDVLEKRYYWKGENGEPDENWTGLCRRVSDHIAKSPDEAEEFFQVMHDGFFLPNTPALTNAGRKDFSMSACFVLPVEDSMEGIFDAVKHTALIHKMGGGTGFDFSQLRPKGEIVGTTKGVASGPCSFILVFDTATGVTKQGGTRRGANMGMLRIDHPDILEFIELKKEEGKLENFNISIAITDNFMEALRKDEEYDLVFKGKTNVRLRAREVWEKIVDLAWTNGEPGVVFIDRINTFNPTPHIGHIQATNPCGEQPLLPYEACVLGSLNLCRMIGEDGILDIERIKNAVRTGIRMLDNIIDIQSYPLPQIEKMHKANRKVGLGVMGWADLLITLGIHYASDEALELAEKVMKTVNDCSVNASEELAVERGTFPNWEGSSWQKSDRRMRNATTTTIAPTGSISIIADCSSGIEPVYEFESEQKRMDTTHKVLHPLYAKWLRENGNGIVPAYFVKAQDVQVEWHIRMQAAFQRHTHNAVSKTINLPNTATKGDVEKAYLFAYEVGCKGLTVYRDGSRKNQVLSGKKTADDVHELPVLKKMKLPNVRDQKLVEMETKDGKVFVHITIFHDRPVEVFTTTPVEGSDREIYDALTRVISTGLRFGIPVNEFIHQLEAANSDHGHVSSIPAALIRAFRLIGHNTGGSEVCPDCGSALIHESGCITCLSRCGYTKC